MRRRLFAQPRRARRRQRTSKGIENSSSVRNLKKKTKRTKVQEATAVCQCMYLPCEYIHTCTRLSMSSYESICMQSCVRVWRRARCRMARKLRKKLLLPSSTSASSDRPLLGYAYTDTCISLHVSLGRATVTYPFQLYLHATHGERDVRSAWRYRRLRVQTDTCLDLRGQAPQTREKKFPAKPNKTSAV